MIIRITLISITIFLSSSAFSTNIRVIDFQKIIDNYTNISLLYDEINEDQLPHKEIFKKDELNLQNELERIEKLNLILDASELELEIENYNKKLSDFNDKIEKFNLHYELQINSFKNRIANIILEELKNSLSSKLDIGFKSLEINKFFISK